MKTKPTIEYAGQLLFRGEKEPKFHNFFPNPWGVREYSHDKIFEVLIREPHEGEKPIYWSWWDEKEQRFEFTFFFEDMLEMCFAYGTEAEEERGRGKKMQTVVELVRRIPLEDVDKVTDQITARRKKEKET